MPSARRSLLGACLLLLAALAVPGGAQAALPWSGCSPAGFQCANLSVPIDRSGTVPGTLTLSATRKPASSGAAAKTAIVALAGGPGQAARPFAEDFATIFKAGLADKDLLVFDQRGTGKSSPLGCASFRVGRGSIASVVGKCAREIGARRGFYRTVDSVADIEALRVAGGYDKLIVFGVSYGTKVALEYAAEHPESVDSLILDSTVPLDAPDALLRTTLASLPRVLGEALCGSAACARATPDVLSDVRSLARRLDRRAARGPVYNGSGKRRTATVGASGLLNVIEAGDLNPQVRAEFPGAVRAAIQGDAAPLLRLSSRSIGLDNGDRLQVGEDGDGSLYFATMCEETASLPWERGASVPTRVRQAEAFVKSQPASTWGLFPSSVALSTLPSLCLGWPNASPPPATPLPLPDVRTLLLAGQYDVRTPLEDAQRLTAQLPRAQLVSVPFTGHSVLTSEQGTCTQSAVNAFLAGGVAAACADTQNAFPVTDKAPRSLRSVPRAPGLPSTVGRTANAVVLTVQDLRQQVVGGALATGALPKALGGLRGGYARIRSKRATLTGYEFVPGLRLTGTYVSGGTSTFTVAGSGARGRVRVSSSGKVTGTLGGRRVSVSASASAARSVPAPLTFAEAAALGGQRLR